MHPGERLTERYRLRSRLGTSEDGELWRADDVVDQSLVTVGLLAGGHPAVPGLTDDPATLAHGVLPPDGDGPGSVFVVMASDRDEALTTLLGGAPPTRGARARSAVAVTVLSPPHAEESPLWRAGRGVLLVVAFATAGALALWSGQLVTPDATSPTPRSAAAAVAPALSAPPGDSGGATGQPAQQGTAALRPQGLQVEAQPHARLDVPARHVGATFRHGKSVVLRVGTSPSTRQPGTAATSSRSAVTAASAPSTTLPTTTTTTTGSATEPPPSATEPPPTSTEPPPTTTEPPPTSTEPPPTSTEPPPTSTEPPPTSTEPPPTTTEPPPTTTEPTTPAM